MMKMDTKMKMVFWTIEMFCIVTVSTFPSLFALEGAFCNFEKKQKKNTFSRP